MASGRIAARRAANKAAIVDAAWELAHDEGLGSVGMRELARKLGMAASSLYEYFDGKNALYDEMFIEGNLALQEQFRNLQASPGATVRESLIAGARRFIEFCDADHARFQLLFQHSIAGWHPSPRAYATAVANFEEMRGYLGSVGITDAASVDLWTAITSGLASQQVANDPGGDRWLRLVDDAVDMYLATRGAST